MLTQKNNFFATQELYDKLCYSDSFKQACMSYLADPTVEKLGNNTLDDQFNLEFDLQQKDHSTGLPSSSLNAEPDNYFQTHKGSAYGMEIESKSAGVEKPLSDRYDKNIPGYIMSKAFSVFGKPKNLPKVSELCFHNTVLIQKLKLFCEESKNRLNGIASISFLFNAKTQEELLEKEVLLRYTQWFVEEQYIHYVFQSKKIQRKAAYIACKNEFFAREIPIVNKQLEKVRLSLA